METLPIALTLRPTPDRAGFCPRDAVRLDVTRLHLPGWRMAVEGDCAVCGHRYVQDLGSGHGGMYPTTLDLDGAETIDPAQATWFSSALRDSWERPDLDPVAFRAVGAGPGGAGLLLNCLDPIYGHALLKLLNAPRLVDESGAARTIVLVPSALAHLVPADVDETWVVDEPVRRLGGWLEHLDGTLRSELSRFDRVELVAAPVQPHPSTFDLERLVADIEPERPGAPTIALSLRDDRRWGRTRDDQGQRVAALCSRLFDAFPDIAVVAVGPGSPGGFSPEVLDLRAEAPDVDDERRWLALLRGSELAIGVHGSNMLLPSGLARATIELVPLSRFGNVLQASLVGESDPLVALFRHRFLYGDDDLSDLHSSRVAALAISTLDGIDRFVAHSTGPAAGVGGSPARPLPPAPARPVETQPKPPLRERVQALLADAAAPLRDRTPTAPALDGHLLSALEAASGQAPLVIQLTSGDPGAALAGAAGTRAADSGAVVIRNSERAVETRTARILLDRLDELGLRPHTVADGRFVATRAPAGPQDPRPLVGLSSAVRARLQKAGLVN